MMKEKDKTAFDRHLQLFRNNLRSHGQQKLLDYFEQTYFAEHRITQWASWYRQSMYNCEWLAHTNMHVESWHNLLKTHILQRKSNVRVDSLMRALRQAEHIFFWKWSRVRAGWVTNVNPGWIKMLGLSEKLPERQSVDLPSTTSVHNPNTLRSRIDVLMQKEANVHNFMNFARLSQLSEETIQLVFKHFSAIRNLLHCVKELPKNLITTAIVANERNVVIPRVIEQYKFNKKRPRLMRNSMSVKSFRSNESTRCNRLLSFQLSGATGDSLTWDESNSPEFETLTCTLSVVTSKKGVTLGGLSFTPMIGGKFNHLQMTCQ